MDWVEARMGCSVEHAWLVLVQQLRADARRWRELQTETYMPGRVKLSEGQAFVIVTYQATGSEAISSRVEKTGNAIAYHLPNGTAGQFIPSLNAKGECRLHRDGEEIEFWQASRILLEPVLFQEGS